MTPPPTDRLEQVPAGTQAAILRAVAAEKFPKMALAPIAGRFSMLYDDLRRIIEKHGYPDKARMLRAAQQLEAAEAAAASSAAHAVKGDPTATVTVPIRPTPVDQADTSGEQEPPEGRLARVPLAQLHVDPENPRDVPRVEDPDIAELATSMAEIGLLQPIVARHHNGTLVVVAGHRRLTAARRLKWSTVPVIIRATMQADDVIAAMLIENSQRKDLDPIEEARGLRYLKAQMGDASDDDVARRIGRTQNHVSARLSLLALSAEDQAALRARELNLGDAVRRARMNSGKVRPAGSTGSPHLGVDNTLAARVKARCNRLAHKKRGRNSVGGVGCGECWESVIRADERDHLHEVNAKLGECVTCGQPVEQVASEQAVEADRG